jgi:hypothetical protein
MATEEDFASFHASVFARLVGQVTLIAATATRPRT